jgi:hypothetical protein
VYAADKRNKQVNIQELVSDIQAAAQVAHQAQDMELCQRLIAWSNDLDRVMERGGVSMLQEVTFLCPTCGADLSREAREFACNQWEQTGRLPWFCDVGCDNCQKFVWFKLEWTLILSQVQPAARMEAIYTCPYCEGEWYPDDGSPCPRCGDVGAVSGHLCTRCGGMGEDMWSAHEDDCPRCHGAGVEPIQVIWSKDKA